MSLRRLLIIATLLVTAFLLFKIHRIFVNEVAINSVQKSTLSSKQ